MRVVGDRPRDELDQEHATAATDDDRPALGIDAAALGERAVSEPQIGAEVQQTIEVRTPVLLLALDEEAGPTRQAPDRRQVGLDTPHPGQELALVVRCPARVQAAVANMRVVRARRPQLERDGGLDVVVLDRKERPPGPDRPDDQGRNSVDRQGLDRRPQTGQPGASPFGRLADRRGFLFLGRDRAELAKLLDPGRHPVADVAVKGFLVEHGHVPRPAGRSAGSAAV